MMPSPQCSFDRPLAEQPSPSMEAPSSHTSGGSTKPSPWRGNLQSQLQPSWLLKLPSSHSSPSSWTPLPHLVSSGLMHAESSSMQAQPAGQVGPSLPHFLASD